VAVLYWLKDYWYIPLFILGIFLLWVFFKERKNPLARIQNEIDAIEAGAYAREMKKRYGLEKAKKKVREKFRTEIVLLDEKQMKQAKELENDPVALARFLVRVAQ